jgi:hypothetical protein
MLTYAILDTDSGNFVGHVKDWQEGVDVVEDLRDPDLLLMEFDNGYATDRSYQV